MIRLLFSALLALSLFGQNPNTAQFGTAVATDQYLLAAKRLSESSLNGSINASTTTVVVSDGTQFLNWQIIRIDSEEMLIQSVSSNTLTIVSGGRGYNGTTAASHTTGAAVRGIITSWHHNQLAAEVKAIETRLRNVTGQCQDAGSTDDYACSPAPPFTAYATGMIVNFKAATANTGAATVNFNSIGAGAIKKVAGGVTTALDDNDIRAGQWVTVVYDGTNFQMISALGNAGSSSGSGISSCVPSGASGTAYTCTPSPAVGSYATGLALAFKPDVASSGSATLNVNGLGLVTLAVLSMDGNLTTLSSGTIQGGIEYLAIYDGTYFVVIGTTSVHVNQVADDGSNLTKRAILNFVGNGVSCVDNSGSSRTDCTIFSPSTVQAGTPLWCRSTTGNDSYTCTLTPTLTAYTRGGCVVLDADTANTGTATIAIDGLASGVGKSILNRAGSALSNGDITANKPITMCYDGTQYIIQGDGASAGSGGTPATQPESETGTDNTAMTTPLAATYSVASAGACGLVRTSTAIITIFPGATTAHPCVVQVGNVSRRFTASASVTLAAGAVSVNASVAYFYIKPNGTIYVGLSSAFDATKVSESGASEETSISDFPAGATKLGTWLAGTTDDQWDSTGGDGNGGNNYISLRTKTSALAGAGIVITESADGEETYTTDTATIPTKEDVVSGGLLYAVTAGSSTAYTLTTPYAIASPNANGVCVLGKMDETSGATPTLAVNGATARALWKHNGTSAAAAVATGDLIANQIYEFCHNTSLNTSGVWEVRNVGGAASGSGSIAKSKLFPIVSCSGSTSLGTGETNIPALSGTLGGPVGGTGCTDTSDPVKMSWGFASFTDNGQRQFVISKMAFPSNLSGTITMKIYGQSNAANTNHTVLSVDTFCMSSNTDSFFDSADAPTYNSAQTLDFTDTNNTKLQFITFTTALTTTGCTAGQPFFIRWGRDSSNGSDTSTDPFYLTGMQLEWLETLQ